jgi:hypothetical protein
MSMNPPVRSDSLADSSASRPVLIWQPDGDESHVRPSVEQAAAFLNVSADEVVAAIDSGELLQGRFVDWQAKPKT